MVRRTHKLAPKYRQWVLPLLLVSAALIGLSESQLGVVWGGGDTGGTTTTTIFSTYAHTTSYVVTISETLYLTETVSGISTAVPYSTATSLSTVTMVSTSVLTQVLPVIVQENPLNLYLPPLIGIVGAILGVVIGRRMDMGRKRKEDIWVAIREWVGSPTTDYRGQDVFPLAERPRTLAAEIEKCLSRNYPSIWADMQQFKNKRAELTSLETGHVPEEFIEKSGDTPIIHLELVHARIDTTRRQLAEMQRQLIHRLDSEILEKHSTSLKC